MDFIQRQVEQIQQRARAEQTEGQRLNNQSTTERNLGFEESCVVVIDTSIISKLSLRTDCTDVVEFFHANKVFIAVPETVVKEVIRTSDPIIRARLSGFLIDMLGDCPVLADMWHQISLGTQLFLYGETAFNPFAANCSDSLKTHLRKPDLRSGALEKLKEERAKQVEIWDGMHARGRLAFQRILEKNKSIPESASWISTMLTSNFVRDVVLESISSDMERELMRSRWHEYISWNPICRSFLELFLLAIRRHAIEPENASSKRGPKWEDYYIGAFVGIADCFVTDDSRLWNALDQYKKLRQFVHCEILSLDGFLKHLQNGDLQSICQQIF